MYVVPYTVAVLFLVRLIRKIWDVHFGDGVVKNAFRYFLAGDRTLFLFSFPRVILAVDMRLPLSLLNESSFHGSFLVTPPC